MTTNDITCPYCFQPRPYQTFSPSSPGTTSEADLDGEIERIEGLISRLFVERSRLSRKRNEMRSPIYSLPPETLALIFKFACPPLDFLDSYGLNTFFPGPFDLGLGLGASGKIAYPLIIGVLSAVSARWRDVVLLSSSLWTSFVADNKDTRLMQTVFARSGNLPVSASFNLSSDRLTAFVAPIVQEHGSRIRNLHLRNASSTWLNQHIPNFLDLELLCIQSGRINRRETVSIDSPCTRLVLKGFESRVTLFWSKIEVLHLTHVSVSVCLEMLEKCTQLIEFRVRSSSTSEVEGVELPNSPFLLPRLELFEWLVDGEDPVDRLMLQYARMPALKTLVWSESSSHLKPSDTLSTFFEHLPRTLSAVRVKNCIVHSGFSIFPHFLNFSDVEDLSFKNCAGTFMDDVFGNLGSEVCLVDDEKVPVLPKLKSIRIDNFTGRLDQEEVLQTFRHRSSQPSGAPRDSSFRLEFAKRQVDWTTEFEEELTGMVEKGYKVELWENSKPVPWLPRPQ